MEEDAWHEAAGKMILCRGKISVTLPHPIRLIGDGYHFILDQDRIKGALIRKNSVLYHFLPNPGDYYFLPEEDIVIPKVLGKSIDKSRRVRAPKKNCHIKKEDAFIRLADKMPTASDIPIFQKEYAGSELYTDVDTIKKHPSIIEDMVRFLIQTSR